MKKMFLLAAAIVIAAGPALAADMTPEQKALVQMEADWSKAIVANDTKFVASIIADDWTGQDDSGKLETKTWLIANMNSGKDKTASMTNHDVSVRIIGDVAIVQGSDTQKSSTQGKDTSGEYNWTDVYVKRGGKWLVIASQDTRVTAKK